MSVDTNGFLLYEKDDSGNPKVNIMTDKKGNTVESGSKTARNFLTEIINNKNVVKLEGGARTCVPESQPYVIGINVRQIESLIKGASSNLDSRTLGWGLIIIHELTHTAIGGGFKDVHGIYNTGDAVDFVNKIRRELNKKGYSFGERLQYDSNPVKKGKARVLFNKGQYVEF